MRSFAIVDASLVAGLEPIVHIVCSSCAVVVLISIFVCVTIVVMVVVVVVSA